MEAAGGAFASITAGYLGQTYGDIVPFALGAVVILLDFGILLGRSEGLLILVGCFKYRRNTETPKREPGTHKEITKRNPEITRNWEISMDPKLRDSYEGKNHQDACFSIHLFPHRNIPRK